MVHEICYEIEIKKFVSHLRAYKIGKITSKMFVKNISQFMSPPLHPYTLNDGNTYIRMKCIYNFVLTSLIIKEYIYGVYNSRNIMKKRFLK